MFLRLVKHELRESFRLLLPVFGGLLLMAGLARGSIALLEGVNDAAMRVVGVTFVVFFFLGCGAAVVLTAVFLIQRFTRSVYGDEGYLTNTLPVSTHAILLSRLLVSALAVLACYCAIAVSVLLCLAGVRFLQELHDTVGSIFGHVELDLSGAVLKSVATGTVGLLTMILQIFAAVAMGHSCNRSKTGMSILFYFALAIGKSLISNLCTALLRSGALQSASVTFQSAVDFSMLYSLAWNLVFCGVFYFLAWFMTRRHLNLA